MKYGNLKIALIIGLLVGVLVMPVLNNAGLAEKIPYYLLILLVGLPALSGIGMALAERLGGRAPLIYQAAKFILVGALNTALDFGALNVLIFMTGYTQGWPLAVLNSISTTLAVINSYLWNKLWVFKTGEKKRGAELAAFILVTVSAIGLNSALVWFGTGFIGRPAAITGEQWANIVKIAATAFSLVWNFVGYKFFVFRALHARGL